MINNFEKAKTVQLSNNFKSTEFDCKGKGCCSVTEIDTRLVDYLQKIREHFGKAVIINSAYRCSTHNKNVGGAKLSKHRYGMAADIRIADISPAEVAKFAESIGILGIGLYDNFVHIDTRDKKAFWQSEKEIPKATFGGYRRNGDIADWQIAALADGFSLKSGADGIWGAECIAVAKKAVCKKRSTYKYKSLTRFLQLKLSLKADGLFGNAAKNAVIEYQRANGLVADGAVGISTWKKLLGV